MVYAGHAGPASGNWVANANGIGLFSFSQPLVTDTTPPALAAGFPTTSMDTASGAILVHMLLNDSPEPEVAQSRVGLPPADKSGEGTHAI